MMKVYISIVISIVPSIVPSIVLGHTSNLTDRGDYRG